MVVLLDNLEIIPIIEWLLQNAAADASNWTSYFLETLKNLKKAGTFRYWNSCVRNLMARHLRYIQRKTAQHHDQWKRKQHRRYRESSGPKEPGAENIYCTRAQSWPRLDNIPRKTAQQQNQQKSAPARFYLPLVLLLRCSFSEYCSNN